MIAYLRRVEDVLGKGWESHVEGQKLKADGDSFRNKLNTQELFDEWSRKVSSLEFYQHYCELQPYDVCAFKTQISQACTFPQSGLSSLCIL